MNKLYHVTLLKTVPKILQGGILPNKPQVWQKRYFGKFPKGYTYMFNDYLDAVRWAFKTDWDVNEPHRTDPRKNEHVAVAIISFVDDGRDWEKDTHIEKSGYRGDWLKTIFPVAPESILLVILDKQWLEDIKKVTAKDYFTRKDSAVTI